MQLLGRLLMLSVWTPDPGGLNVRAASGPPCEASHTHLDPEKQSSLKAPGLVRFHVVCVVSGYV